ncbi:MAG: tRNA (guanosine(37)-N1)-methyltransferase TrmD [Candidatus Izemoplasmatales bacterium]|jgi:tRNA (guanine37-N1)-methyltransferase|nr:tRNA (guanosine(37)-N1)-methyltransferase TrmD [Candidatus Izemoplasmatales bacterium]
MKITVLTLFPEIFANFLQTSIIKRAQNAGVVTIEVIDFREYATNKHKQVDDSAYGGGPGMVISVEPIHRALLSIDGFESANKVLLSPQGETFDQATAIKMASYEHLILIAGHYEGFDERVYAFVDSELSIGDYVLTGGELPAMVVIDAVTRLIPGALGKVESFEQDSFYNGLLDFPQYTRPYEYLGMKVPDVLLSGNHQEIEKWRQEEARKRTKNKRPDLLKKRQQND